MNRIIYTDGFLEDMLQVKTQKLEDEIFDTIDLLPHIAIMGSTNLPDSIATRYGSNVRKLPIKPFDVIYEITSDKDFVVLGMIHQRSAK